MLSSDDIAECRLWRVRVEALCNSKDLEESLFKESSLDRSTEECMKLEGLTKKASNIAGHSLTNGVLRRVLQNIGKPCRVLQEIDELVRL